MICWYHGMLLALQKAFDPSSELGLPPRKKGRTGVGQQMPGLGGGDKQFPAERERRKQARGVKQRTLR